MKRGEKKFDIKPLRMFISNGTAHHHIAALLSFKYDNFHSTNDVFNILSQLVGNGI